ncbi:MULTISPECIES: DUF86 domain-containing protein [unclassified Virgibacillus]|uniref:type VII toxin-antitoxin system HepT family RNase toxin n=1 Tax=unclassified Virgibacillus TaxID=2620237 RepID=UPI0024DEEFD6|nr:DUF86 domain-containing protein [Virgibacillus sp. LDC-1]
MYFVDRTKIEKILQYLDSVLEEVKQMSPNSFGEKLALERASQVIIEAILDVGNMMIDGFIMRDPGSYTDIIDILGDEQVLPKGELDQYKEIIHLRKMLVNAYIAVEHDQLYETVHKHLPMLEQFGVHVRTYLQNELGVANAFTNE